MSSTISVFVISPDTRSERRFNLHITVGQLKVAYFVLPKLLKTESDHALSSFRRVYVDKARAYHWYTCKKPVDFSLQFR